MAIYPFAPETSTFDPFAIVGMVRIKGECWENEELTKLLISDQNPVYSDPLGRGRPEPH